ncbi:type II toxin-antitoxin system RelE family toxin [Rhodoplanes sp. SY1]|uniref:type II toxin-antitoxin system RelE family toxin n=1 Tax=Rhodoplanes sp. SY1 TaxID=3166646 RepID=UPI0038B4F14C
MKHLASPDFWTAYRRLPDAVRDLADKNFALLKQDPRHPSLHMKKVGRFWSARVGLQHRALAVEIDGGLLWFWIGSHADYDGLVG